MPQRASTAAKHYARRVSKVAAAELQAGGALRVEECDDDVVRTRRWRFSRGLLGPGEALFLDPRHLPPGTELGIVRPSRVQWPLENWMLHAEVATILLVSKKRLYNLMALHKLERRMQWIGRGHDRRRIALLPPATCRRLAEVTGRAYLITSPS